MVFEVTLRTVEADGQALLIPRVEVEAYWTSLSDDAATVVELYPSPWYQRAVPQRVEACPERSRRDRPGPGTVAVREIPNQRAGATFGDGGLPRLVGEVDWPGEPAGG